MQPSDDRHKAAKRTKELSVYDRHQARQHAKAKMKVAENEERVKENLKVFLESLGSNDDSEVEDILRELQQDEYTDKW